MSDFDSSTELPDPFCGVAKLFPLPNLVLFPHVIQPLHVFEPRYRVLLEDALDADKLFAMAWLLPGWEADRQERPPIAPVVCLGGVMAHSREDDGRYNVLLRGLRRAKIVRELSASAPYRSAEVELLEDRYTPAGGDADSLRDQLVELVRKTAPRVSSGQIDLLLGGDLTLAMLTDVVAYAANLPLTIKQQLLEEPCVDRRAESLVARLSECSDSEGPGRGFPPDFSSN